MVEELDKETQEDPIPPLPKGFKVVKSSGGSDLPPLPQGYSVKKKDLASGDIGGTVGSSKAPSSVSIEPPNPKDNPFGIGQQFNKPPKLEAEKLDLSNTQHNAAIAEQIKTPLKKIPLTPILDNTKMEKPITEIDKREAERKYKQHQIDMETAIDNTTLKVLKQKGIVAGKGSPYYEAERKKIEEKTKPTMIGGIVVNGAEATYHKDKDGNIGLDRNLGFLEGIRKGFNSAVEGEDEANAFAQMDTKQKVEYANKQMEGKPTEYMEERGGVGELLGGAAPYLIKATAAATAATAAGIAAPASGGASLVGLAPVLTVLLTAPDMIKQGQKDEVMTRYMQLKQENPFSKDEDLMKIAEQGEISGGIVGAAEALAFTTSLKLPILKDSKDVLTTYLKGVASSAVHLGGIMSGTTAAKIAERKLEGYNVDTDKAIDEIATSFTENATAGAILNGIISGAHILPKAVKSAFKYALKDTPTSEIKTALDANVQAGRIPPEVAEQTISDIVGYKEALAKTADGLKPETQASVAGLIQARDNVAAEMATKDPTQRAVYEQKIEAYNKQIEKITETNDPLKYEIDEVTGNPIDKVAPKGEPEQISKPIELSTEPTKKAEDTKLSQPIEGVDEQGIPIGDNVPTPTEVSGNDVVVDKASNVGGDVMPKEVSDLYSEAASLRFTLNALKQQMRGRELVGKSKAEYESTKTRLDNIELKLSEYEKSKSQGKPKAEEVKKEKAVETKQTFEAGDEANYYDDLFDKTDKVKILYKTGDGENGTERYQVKFENGQEASIWSDKLQSLKETTKAETPTTNTGVEEGSGVGGDVAAKINKVADEYLYHGTGEGAFRRIREEGLTPQGEKYLYFADKEQYAKTYAQRKGNSFGDRVLRVKKSDAYLPDENTTGGDFKIKNKINPNDIEIKHNGKWIPIQEFADENIGIMPISKAVEQSLKETTKTETTENPALKDVESTDKALEGVDTFHLVENEGEWKATTKTYRGREIGNWAISNLDKKQQKEYLKIRDEADTYGTKEQAEENLKKLKDFEQKNKEAFERAKQEIDALKEAEERKAEERKKQQNIFDQTEQELNKLSDKEFDKLVELIDEKRRQALEQRFGDRVEKRTLFRTPISEAYHKAKADGSNPELVKAVEQSLSTLKGKEVVQPSNVGGEGVDVGDVVGKTFRDNYNRTFEVKGENSGILTLEDVDTGKVLRKKKSEVLSDFKEIIGKGNNNEQYINLINKVGKNEELTKDDIRTKMDMQDKQPYEYDKDVFDKLYSVSIKTAGNDKGITLKNKVTGETHWIHASDLGFYGNMLGKEKSIMTPEVFKKVFEEKNKKAALDIAYKNKIEESEYQKSKKVGEGVVDKTEAKTEPITNEKETTQDTNKTKVEGKEQPLVTDPTSKGEGAKEPPKGETKELDKLANNVPDSGKITEYMSKDTIEKYTGETPTNDQSRGIQELEIALNHGEKIIEKAKEIYGKDYAEKTLEYINNSTTSVSNKALMYVSLENALGREKIANPDKAAELTKQQALVYKSSQAFARENSLALNYQKLRKIAQVGYDITKVTDNFFSAEELVAKKDLEKAIEADANTINKEAEFQETAGFSAEVEKQINEGVSKEIEKIYQQLPKEKKTAVDKAIAALENVQTKLRSKTYDATIGIPVAVIDMGITTIKLALKAGVKIADAIELGISKIKDKYGKELEKAREDEIRKDLTEAFSKIKTNKDIVKESLIEKGFGRELTVKGEKKQILDWKKLAGEAGTVEKIRENVEQALSDKNYTKTELESINKELEKEYVDLRASVIEKAQNELARRNKETVTADQKSAAKKLAELYTYGLFEQKAPEFENTLNKALGAKVSEAGYNEAKAIAKGLETLYTTSFKGVKLNDVSAKAAIEKLEDRLRVLLFRESKSQGNFALKAASMVRNYFDIQQTMILNNLKQAVENPLSGLQQNLIDKIGVQGTSTPELANQRRKLMKSVYADMMIHGGIGYGKVESTFVNRQHIDDYVNKLSDSKLYHGIASTLTGKATLNTMDAMWKAGITEKKFTNNLIKILTHPTNKNRMGKEDALKFVSEKLTGQTFKDAQETAKNVIEKINKDAGTELISTNQNQVDRFANDIVKASLEMGNKITPEQISAAYNAAYKSAGLGLGHTANNIVSSMVTDYSAKIEGNINQAIKNKEWNRAAMLTYKSILFRNVLNPFVGGGTNWLVLKLEKTGLGLFTGLAYQVGSKGKIDVSTELGMKRLEERLYNQARIKDNYMRGLVGGMTSLLTYAAFTNFANEDEYRKWRAKNKWAAKYLDTITPEYLLAEMAVKDKKVKQYLSTSFNKNDAFDASTKFIKSGEYFVKGDKSKAWGALGEAMGSKINVPLPWRLAKDGQVIYQGATGQDPYHGNYKPSEGFWSGALQGGAIEWLGGRPVSQSKGEYNSEELKDETLKHFKDKGVNFPEMNPEKIQTKEVNNKVVEKLSDYDEATQKLFIKKKKEYLKIELNKLKNNAIKVYVDKYGNATTTKNNKNSFKPFAQLTTEQIQNVISSSISGNVTEKVKKEVLKGKSPIKKD